jgi:hypothetical protein
MQWVTFRRDNMEKMETTRKEILGKKFGLTWNLDMKIIIYKNGLP